MIYHFEHVEAYLDIMLEITNDLKPPEPGTLIFYIPEALNIYDIPLVVYRCPRCHNTEHFCINDIRDDECQQCGVKPMYMAAEVEMIVQGGQVVYRRKE